MISKRYTWELSDGSSIPEVRNEDGYYYFHNRYTSEVEAISSLDAFLDEVGYHWISSGDFVLKTLYSYDSCGG